MNSRRGFSTLELLAVVTILALIAAVALSRNGRSLLGNYGSQGDARRIALALQQAKRRAITEGNNHAVQFAVASGQITSFSVVSISGATTTVDGPTTLTPEVSGTCSHTQMVFNFEGQASATYWVQLAGSQRTFRIDVVPVTGAINVSELP